MASALTIAMGSAPSIAVAAGGTLAASGVAHAVSILKSAVTGAALAAVLMALYRDSYYAGAEEAARVGGGKLPPAVETEMDLPTGGLGELLSQSAHTIQGINHTTIDRIGDIIYEGIQSHADRADIARQIDEFLNTPRRSEMIAETEYARAWSAAVMETYRHNGVTQVAWRTEPGACPECVQNEAASPQPAANPKWPAGPIPVHPWTRCAVVPYRGER